MPRKAVSLGLAIVFSLALNSVSEHHGAFSGILCTGILGGAVVPLLVGLLGDRFGLRTAMLTVFATLGYILSISWWARPLIRNETVGLLELFTLRRQRSASYSLFGPWSPSGISGARRPVRGCAPGGAG